MKYRISLDVMGGDNAPGSALDAALKFVQNNEDVIITLVGLEEVVTKFLKENPHPNLTSCYAKTFLNMESNLLAACRDRESSMHKTIKLVLDKKVDAALSAGPTGPLVTVGYHLLKMIEEIKKPALLATLPQYDNSAKPLILLDVGASIKYDAHDLHNLGICGSVYFKAMYGEKNPRIGLLNNGSENHKGTDLYLNAHKLLVKDKKVNFIGNVEPGILFNNEMDVCIGDGFTTNIALKAIEAAASMTFKALKRELTRKWSTKMKALLLRKSFRKVRDDFDPRQFNGALIMGLNGIVLKAHGSSDEISFLTALRNTKIAVKNNLLLELKKGFK